MSQWIVCPLPRAQPRLRLFCCAYAGGSAWVFRTWAEQLPITVEVCAVELPGRGKRLIEPALTDMFSLIQALGPELLPYLDRPFACFGHSLGALVVFELCRWLRRTVQLTPTLFWASAARAPQLSANKSPIHTLPDPDFITALRRYNGTPTNVLNNAELMALMLPTLRADFSVLETYQYQPSALLTYPIIGLWGQQDTIVSQAEVAAWQAHASSFSIESIPGNHFFMQQPWFPQKLLPRLAELVA